MGLVRFRRIDRAAEIRLHNSGRLAGEDPFFAKTTVAVKIVFLVVRLVIAFRNRIVSTRCFRSSAERVLLTGLLRTGAARELPDVLYAAGARFDGPAALDTYTRLVYRRNTHELAFLRKPLPVHVARVSPVRNNTDNTCFIPVIITGLRQAEILHRYFRCRPFKHVQI